MASRGYGPLVAGWVSTIFSQPLNVSSGRRCPESITSQLTDDLLPVADRDVSKTDPVTEIALAEVINQL